MINDGVSGQYDDSTGRPITRRISELGESDVTIEANQGPTRSSSKRPQPIIVNYQLTLLVR